MKSTRFIILLTVISAILVQCKPDPKAKITALEARIAAENFTLDEKGMQTANELVAAYTDYAEKYKESQEAPDYLYKAADISLNTNRSREALDLYNKIIYQYPDFKKVPECLFLVAYIYENYEQNFGKAKEVYEMFIAKYPTHDFADDAAISIQNMGKSPEELIRMFEEKNRVQQDTLRL